MRPLPVLSVKTHAEHLSFLRALYAGGLRWCSFELHVALDELKANKDVYDDCSIVWLDPYGEIMFDGLHAIDNMNVTHMNSAAHFVSYARVLIPELEVAASYEMESADWQ